MKLSTSAGALQSPGEKFRMFDIFFVWQAR